MDEKINRRSFMKKGVIGTAAAGICLSAGSASEAVERLLSAKTTGSKEGKEDKPFLEYRTLGRTGLRVTAIGYGAMETKDPAVIHRAIDYGLNYIDTARAYMGGENEYIVGKVLKARRKEVYIATKFHIGSMKDMMSSVETSLKALQTDYIDVMQIHNLKKVEQVENEDAMEALERMKKEGKIRFKGFTTHKNQVELLKAAIKNRFYDVVLVAYNFKSPPELTEAIKEAAEAGIGIVAMKTQAGGYKDHKLGNLSPHQAALKWVLQNPGVATTVPGMDTYSKLEENIGAMGKKLGWSDRKTLHRYSKAIEKIYCRMCGRCEDSCPKGVAISDVNRCLMYAEGYGDMELATSEYLRIPRAQRARLCLTCDGCLAKCPNGLDIGSKMASAIKLLELQIVDLRS